MKTDSPSAYSSAEAGARRLMLQGGLGVVAFIAGGFFTAGAGARLGERLGVIESEAAAMVLRTVLERLWLIAILPVIAFGVGRFTEVSATRFALTAGLSGEIFSVLLTTSMNGLDFLVDDHVRLAFRGLTLFIGLTLTWWAAGQGREGAAQAQAEADLTASAQKAQYAKFLAAETDREKSGSGLN